MANPPQPAPQAESQPSGDAPHGALPTCSPISKPRRASEPRDRQLRQLKIGLQGTVEYCRDAAGPVADVFTILSVSKSYPDRGHSALVRVYVEAELPGGGGE